MKTMKKILFLTTLVLALTAGSIAVFADTPSVTLSGISASSLDELRAERLALHQEVLAERVSAGTLTQDEADEILAQIQERQEICDGFQTGQYGGFGIGAGGYGLTDEAGERGQGHAGGYGLRDGSGNGIGAGEYGFGNGNGTGAKCNMR